MALSYLAPDRLHLGAVWLGDGQRVWKRLPGGKAELAAADDKSILVDNEAMGLLVFEIER